MDEQLLHDCAWMNAHAHLDLIAHKCSEQEQRELFASYYNASRACLESYCIQSERQQRRITPSKN